MPSVTVLLENNAKTAFYINRISVMPCLKQYKIKLTILAKRDSI